MDKSLDDLIKEKAKTGKSKFQGKFKGSSNRNERRTEPYKNQTALVQPTTQNTKINYTGSSTQQKATFSVKSLLPPNQSVKPSTVGVSTAISNYAASAPIVNSGGSIFDRIGNKKSQQSGTSVTISNLGQDVTVADLGELCGRYRNYYFDDYIILNPSFLLQHRRGSFISFYCNWCEGSQRSKCCLCTTV